MRLTLKKRTANKLKTKMKNKARIRKKVQGTLDRPRLAVFKSGKHTYAQLIDDLNGVTLASASTLDKTFSEKKSNKAAAKLIGEAIAKKAEAKKITNVVFDRSGYVYHGRVQSIAEGARDAGLKF